MKKGIKKNYSLTYPKIVAIGFALLILLGSALLMLPISSKLDSVSYIDALFTATSATCITGLIPFDTFSSWTTFGQLVLLCLIQIGGLGFITILAVLSALLKGKMSLKQKMLLKESVSSASLGDVRKITKSVILFTALTEGAGAIILMFRFIPLTHSVPKGIYMAVFTSISAFCNAGFDLMGMFAPGSSLTTVNSDPVIMITIMLLVVLSGLGFFVWEDMKDRKFKIKQYSVHTKLVIVSTLILLFGGAILFFIFEYNATLKDMNWFEKILNALFCSVTPRTAGFNSVEISQMTNNSKGLTILLMFIGGSTGSTAGGVKTTTVALLVLCAISNIRNKQDIEIFGKRVDLDTVKNAVSICMINMFYILAGTVVISLNQSQFKLVDVIYECTSAMGTVGITAGITPSLNTFSMIVIIMLMYIGRLTSLIFALSFVATKPRISTQKPKGRIMIG